MSSRATIAPLVGVARESFFAAQARCRAGARRWARVMAVVVFAIALVISLLLAPIAFALFGLLIDLVNLVVAVPDVLGMLGRGISAIADQGEPVPVLRLAGLGVLAALPGFAVLVALWWRLDRIAGRADFAGVRAVLGLRDPRPEDPEERQLGDVVQEMSIAAGRTPPRLQLLDHDACNLGLLGDDARAVLVVTRGTLDRLDRAQTQALVGRALAALGNGDGLLAARGLRLDLMVGLLMLMAQAPIDKASRAALRAVLHSRAGGNDLDALRHALGDPAPSSVRGDSPQPPRAGAWRDWLVMPFMGSMLLGILIVPVSVMLFVAPLNGMVWRRRRLLGDAMAVQFTRDPEALAEAYAVLARLSSALDLRAQRLGGLFVLDPGGSSNLSLGSPYPRYRTRIARLDALGAAVALPAHRPVPVWAWAIGLPLATVLVGLLGCVIVLGAWLSLALNGLFLALPTGLVHPALRALGQ